MILNDLIKRWCRQWEFCLSKNSIHLNYCHLQFIKIDNSRSSITTAPSGSSTSVLYVQLKEWVVYFDKLQVAIVEMYAIFWKAKFPLSTSPLNSIWDVIMMLMMRSSLQSQNHRRKLIYVRENRMSNHQLDNPEILIMLGAQLTAKKKQLLFLKGKIPSVYITS
jgi:hypothetical protein